MDISVFRNLGQLAPQIAQRATQQLSKAQVQEQAKFLGQTVLPGDSLNVKSKGGPSNRLSSNRLLSDLEPEERAALGGGSALDTLARVQPSLTLGEAQPLLRNKSALETIANLMESRNDLRVSDFMSVDRKGQVRIDPSYKDPETMEFLKQRPDISPREITAMRANFTKKFKNPAMGRAATKKALDLLKKRTDMNPDDATELMNKVAQAAGVGDKGAKGADPAAAPQAALDMFDSASKLLQKRNDIKPDQVGELAKSVGGLGSPKDKQKAGRVAEGFDSATKSLENNSMRRPDELSQMASTIGEHFKGGDEKTAGFRMDAFKESSKMMSENGNLDSKSVGNFLKTAKENDPKIKNAPPAKKAQKLAGAMSNLSSGLKSGKVSSTNLNQHFDNKKADEDRGKINKNKSKEQQGISDKAKPGDDKKQKSTFGLVPDSKSRSSRTDSTAKNGVQTTPSAPTQTDAAKSQNDKKGQANSPIGSDKPKQAAGVAQSRGSVPLDRPHPSAGTASSNKPGQNGQASAESVTDGLQLNRRGAQGGQPTA